jgi:hypothetical protein
MLIAQSGNQLAVDQANQLLVQAAQIRTRVGLLVITPDAASLLKMARLPDWHAAELNMHSRDSRRRACKLTCAAARFRIPFQIG